MKYLLLFWITSSTNWAFKQQWKCFSGQCSLRMATESDESSLLIRALRGEAVERTPVWLMRQVSITIS